MDRLPIETDNLFVCASCAHLGLNDLNINSKSSALTAGLDISDRAAKSRTSS